MAASALPPLPSASKTKNESADNMAVQVMVMFIYERSCRSNRAPASRALTPISKRDQSPKSTDPAACEVVSPALRAANTPVRQAIATVRRTTARRKAAVDSESSCHLAPNSDASTESSAISDSSPGSDSPRSLARRASWSSTTSAIAQTTKTSSCGTPVGITIWLSTCTSTPRAYESAVARAKYGVRAKRRAKLAWAVDPQ